MIEFSKIDANGTTTIPEVILKDMQKNHVDTLVWRSNGNGLYVCEATNIENENTDIDFYLIEKSCQEWLSPEDDEAYRDLQHLRPSGASVSILQSHSE